MPNFPDNLKAAKVFNDAIMGSIAKEFRKIDEQSKANAAAESAEEIAQHIKQQRSNFLTKKLYESLAIYAVNIEAYRVFYADNQQAIEAIRQKVQNDQPLSSAEENLRQEFTKKVNQAKWASVQFHGYYHKIKKMQEKELDSELKQFLTVDRDFNQALYQAISQVTGQTLQHEDYALSLQDLIDEFNLAENPKLKIISPVRVDNDTPLEKASHKLNVRFVEGDVAPPIISSGEASKKSRLKEPSTKIKIDQKHQKALETGADLNWDDMTWNKRTKQKVPEIKLLKNKKNIAKTFRDIEQKEKQLLESFATAQESLITLSSAIQKLPSKEQADLQKELNRLVKTIDSELRNAFQGKNASVSLQENTGQIKVKWQQDQEIDLDDLDTIDAYSAALNGCTIGFTQKEIDTLKGKINAVKPTKGFTVTEHSEPEFDMKLRSSIIRAHLQYSSDNSPTVLRKPSKHFFESQKKAAKASAAQPPLSEAQRFEIRGSLYGNGITQRWETLIPEMIELISATPAIKLQDGQALASQVLTSEMRGFYEKMQSGNLTPQDVDEMKGLLAFMNEAHKQEKFANNNAMDVKLYRFSQDIDKIGDIAVKNNTSENKNTPTPDKIKKHNYFSFNLHLQQKAKKVVSTLKKVKQKKSTKRKKP